MLANEEDLDTSFLISDEEDNAEQQVQEQTQDDPVPVPDLLRKGAQRAPVARAEQAREGRRCPAEVSDLRVRVQVHCQRFRVQRVQEERERQRLARVLRCEGEQDQVHLQQGRNLTSSLL